MQHSDRIEPGVCQATLIGTLVDEPQEIGTDRNGKPIISTTMVVSRPAKGAPMKDGHRARVENVFEITASGTAAANIVQNFRPGRRAFIMGELTVTDESVMVHAAQLSWLDKGVHGV